MDPQNLEGSSQHPSATAPLFSVAQSDGGDGMGAFVAEARSIQALLQDYQQRSQALKDDVSAFMHRDIDEHAKLLHLRATVDQAELAALRDSKYMEYIAKHKQKQSQDFSGAPYAATSTNAVGASGKQGSSPHAVGSVLKGRLWWVEKLKNSDATKFGSWLPDKILALNDEESVVGVWLGWKNPASASEESFNRVVNRVYPNPEVDPAIAGKAFCCFGNGFLCTKPAEVYADVFSSLEKAASFIVTKAKDLSDVDNCASRSESLTRRIAWVASLYSTELYSAVAMPRSRFVDCMWPKCDLGASNKQICTIIGNKLRLSGDGLDTLAFVDPERLRTTITIRAFFFHGDLGLVEQFGAEVDMTALLLPTDHDFTANEDSRTWVRSSIARTLRALYAVLTAHTYESGDVVDVSVPTNLVLTVALNLPVAKDGLFDGVLLDARPVSPQLPFEGCTTWMEVCAVGRQRNGVRRTAEDNKKSETQNASSDLLDENIVFRLAYLPVAFLQPYDAISQRIFPLLNEAM
ncbi:hypothetical protein ABL78_4336 [Leptomonas seymouri]|uniref:Uncharacterized protein n=1 Tax=Leptomonas seymouri TaxID=5684 RepID=A0A0N0P605_LEPSE|nr:hypothetical protein ABL78_4336 [Leptomonas seymouri]|eukprot:KPI86607.1 hypothetical protein ABL78_4336 [Leptomonas seymouri]